MAFRDDREVLKQKARDLERDLAQAEGKLEAQKGEADRVKRLEEELAEARGVLNRIEAQLPKPASSGRKTAILAVGVLGVAAGGAIALTRSSSAPLPPLPAIMNTPALPVQISAAPPPPVATPTVSTVKIPSAPEPVKEVRAHWAGKAKTVTGAAIKPGAPCSVDAVLRSSHRHEVTISCGSEVLYRSTDVLNGSSMMSTGVEEYPAEKEGKARAALRWNDIGSRTGPRTQASINSDRLTASAWSEMAPSYRVDIDIPTLSEAYEGTFDAGHSHDALAFKERIESNAKVTSTKGQAPIKIGASCRARLSPNWDERLNCRVLLWCGGRELYGSGSTGFSKCDVAEGAPTAFRDELQEGDPMLTWDIAKGTIALVVEECGAEWSADFSVSAKP